MHLSLRVAVVAAALIPSLTLHALADQRYGVAGEDTYRIGRVLNETHITYHGIEHLGIATDSQGKRYVADVAYTRVDDTGKASVHGKFEQELLHDGSFEDRRDEDPDFLTILNQPFAVQLDLTTLRDLERMQGTVPFAAASPLGGSRLVGSLRAAPPGKIDGRMVVGVRFKADGPMTGTLPQHPDALLSGTMHMDGTAFYAEQGALLLALDATLTIDGQLQSGKDSVPVKITYHRLIRASEGSH
jgi:hypothetical protein